LVVESEASSSVPKTSKCISSYLQLMSLLQQFEFHTIIFSSQNQSWIRKKERKKERKICNPKNKTKNTNSVSSIC
jgi:hypothetical protein